MEVGLSALEKLVATSSGPIALGNVAADPTSPLALAALLARCDGFYAFESALHVFPSRSQHGEHSLREWNAPDLWRYEYESIPDDNDYVFFAEDVFGGQFAIAHETVSVFDPETGEFDPIADDLEGWAQALLTDYPNLTGHPLAHDWQSMHGPLRPGRRLIPKVPFVLGGDYAVENLYDAEAVHAMRYRGHLAAQMRDLPDGSAVRLRIID